ncbi:hypothetical protein C211_10910 [Stutzerimonas degradans]|nr:hypothetical protein C211_10910 [Stutzerimonas degradans]
MWLRLDARAVERRKKLLPRGTADLQLSDLLEMAEAAKWFGLSEQEEMYACGLFGNHYVPDHP